MQLRNFYRDMNRAIKSDKNRPYWFKSNNGICENLYQWCEYHNTGYKEFARLNGRLKKQFFKAGLNVTLPFNQGMNSGYFVETKRNTVYLNKDRIAWIKKHV